MSNYQLFYWHLELSSKCSLKCPRCPRTEERNKDKYKVTELDLPFIKKVFTKDLLTRHVKRILLCGGQGDPIYCKDILPILRYFKDVNPNLEIIITTNGSYKTEEWWKELASIVNVHDIITFSVDGWDDESNNKYRVNSNFESILTGVRIMGKSSALVMWNSILFKFNQQHIERILNVAKDNNADFFNITISSLVGSKDSSWLDENGIDVLEPDSDFVRMYTESAGEERHPELQNDISVSTSLETEGSMTSKPSLDDKHLVEAVRKTLHRERETRQNKKYILTDIVAPSFSMSSSRKWNNNVHLSDKLDKYLLRHRMVPTFRYHIKYNQGTFNTVIEHINDTVIPLCKSGNRGLYIDAEGILYPCSWVSHPFGTRKSKVRDKKITWEKSLWVEHKEKFNLHTYDLDQVLNNDILCSLHNGWKDSSKTFVECEQKCSAKKITQDLALQRVRDTHQWVKSNPRIKKFVE